MKTNRNPEKIRVMLVDDHALLREALRKVIELEPDIEVVAEANSGPAAIQILPRINPDVILMDSSMPEMSGSETTRRLKQLQPKAKIVGLTLFGESTYLEEMVSAGASGYVVKTGALENVITALRAVNKGGTYFDPAVPRGQPPSAAPPRRAVEELTAAELAVVKLVANGGTNSEIASSLGLKLKTVETRRDAAMKKLGLNSRAGLVRTAAERNWFAD